MWLLLLRSLEFLCAQTDFNLSLLEYELVNVPAEAS